MTLKEKETPENHKRNGFDLKRREYFLKYHQKQKNKSTSVFIYRNSVQYLLEQGRIFLLEQDKGGHTRCPSCGEILIRFVLFKGYLHCLKCNLTFKHAYMKNNSYTHLIEIKITKTLSGKIPFNSIWLFQFTEIWDCYLHTMLTYNECSHCTYKPICLILEILRYKNLYFKELQAQGKKRDEKAFQALEQILNKKEGKQN